MSTPSDITRSATKASAVPGRKYASPAELEAIYPYSKYSWRQWYYSGKLRGCLKPAGKRGRLLILLEEAERVMREGLGEAAVSEGAPCQEK